MVLVVLRLRFDTRAVVEDSNVHTLCTVDRLPHVQGALDSLPPLKQGFIFGGPGQ